MPINRGRDAGPLATPAFGARPLSYQDDPNRSFPKQPDQRLYLSLNGCPGLRWNAAAIKNQKIFQPGLYLGLTGGPFPRWGGAQKLSKNFTAGLYLGLNGGPANRYGSLLNKAPQPTAIGSGTLGFASQTNFSSTVALSFFAKTLQPIRLYLGLTGGPGLKYGSNSKQPAPPPNIFTLDPIVTLGNLSHITLSASATSTIFLPIGSGALNTQVQCSLTGSIAITIDANIVPLEAVSLQSFSQLVLSTALTIIERVDLGSPAFSLPLVSRTSVSGDVQIVIDEELFALGQVFLFGGMRSSFTANVIISIFDFDPTFIAEAVWQVVLSCGPAGEVLCAINKKPAGGGGTTTAGTVSAGGRGLYFEPQTIDKLIEEIKKAYALASSKDKAILERVVEKQPIYITQPGSMLGPAGGGTRTLEIGLPPESDEVDEEAITAAIAALLEDE